MYMISLLYQACRAGRNGVETVHYNALNRHIYIVDLIVVNRDM